MMKTATDKASEFAEGRDLYREYLRHGEATLKPRAEIIAKMSRQLDLRQSYIRARLDAFLWSESGENI